jgi:hypothetical protein
LIIAVVIGAIRECILFTYSSREVIGRRQFFAKVDELKKSGQPVDDASFETVYRDRTDDTNTDAWLNVFNELEVEKESAPSQGVYQLDPKSTYEPFVATGEWKYDEANRRYLKRFESLMDRVRDLARARKPVYFPKQFKSVHTEMNEINVVRDAAQLLRLDGYVSIRENKPQRLLDDIVTLFNLSEIVENEPGIVGSLVSIAIDDTAIDLIEQALASNAFTKAELTSLESRLLEEAKHVSQWHKMIRDERAAFIPVFSNPTMLSEERKNKKTHIPARGWDGLKYLELMESADAIDGQDFVELLNKCKQLEQDVAQLHKGYLPNIDHVFTGLLFPAVPQIGQALVTREHKVRMAVYATGCSLYMLEHAQAPPSLESLALPHDQLALMGGKPPGYRVENDGSVQLWLFDLETEPFTPSEPPGPKNPLSLAPESFVWTIPIPSGSNALNLQTQ